MSSDEDAQCAVQLQSEKSWVRWVDEAFSKLDVNGDGFISMEEIMDKLPLETTDPDDDMESERFLQVLSYLQCHLPGGRRLTCECCCVMSQSPRPSPYIFSTVPPASTGAGFRFLLRLGA